MKRLPVEGVEVKFSTPQWYKGRNGVGNSKALIMQTGTTSNSTRFSPINSRDHFGSCWLDVPTEDIPAITLAHPNSAGNLILDHLPRKTLPLLIGIHPALDTEIERRLKDGANKETG